MKTCTKRRKHCVGTEAEIGVMCLAKQLQDCQQPPETRRGAWHRLSLRVYRKVSPALLVSLIWDIWCPELEENTFLFCFHLFWQP